MSARLTRCVTSGRPPAWTAVFRLAVLCAFVVRSSSRKPSFDDSRMLNASQEWIVDVRHGTNLFWIQNPYNISGLSRIVSIYGDPDVWVTNRTATTSYIVAPNTSWQFSALTFNFNKHTLYWSDIGNKKIQGFILNTADSPFTIFDGISSAVYSLSLDWLTNNIYWADSLYNWIVMAPAVQHTDLFRIVVSTDLDHPMGLVVYPYRGLLFWTDWGAVAKIEKSNTDGSNRRTVVDTDLLTPMGLVLDADDNRLYWVDRDRATIESIHIFTSERRLHFTVDGTQFVSIALYRDYLFVTDQKDNLLYVFNKKSGKHEVNFSITDAKPANVVMYDSGLQKYVKPLTSSLCDVISCEHMCVSKYGGRVECICASGYELQADGKSCADNGVYPTPMFVYSIGDALCRFPGNLPDMRLDDVTLATQCFLTNRRSILALAANIRENTLYFAENATKTISKVKLVRGESPEIIIGGTGIVEGLSVDWLASNIYWSDSYRRLIMVSKTDGRYQRELHSDRLDKPTGLVVDAVNRVLYWSDRGPLPRIERSFLDGTERQFFVLDDLGSPTHLSIDYLTNKLFWTDSLTSRIESISLDGKQRQTVMSQPEATYFGITLFQDFVVWTETGQKNGIHAGLKHNGKKIRGIIHPGIGRASDVITFDLSTQPMASGPCEMFNGCQQLCLPSDENKQRQCACAMGFQQGADGKSCVTEPWYDNFLLFADTFQKQIYQMNMDTGSVKAIALSGQDNPISVDFDPELTHIYWSDVSARVLMRSRLNGSDQEIVKLLSADSTPDGIALDPVSRLLYYTDAGNKIIAAISLVEKYHVTLIKRRLNKPRAIALDPIRGYMYWTDWSNLSRIEKAAMDGSDRRIIVDTGVGGWPNGLTIDIRDEKLYWCNARTETIEMSDLDGNNRRVIYRTLRAHFFGITLSGDILYYTDWTKKTIMKLQKVRSQYNATPIGQAVFARANDIHAYKSETYHRAINTNACSLHNGGCSHVCLPTPQGRKCACPDDMKAVTCRRQPTGSRPRGPPTQATEASPGGQPDSQHHTTGRVATMQEARHSTSAVGLSNKTGSRTSVVPYWLEYITTDNYFDSNAGRKTTNRTSTYFGQPITEPVNVSRDFEVPEPTERTPAINVSEPSNTEVHTKETPRLPVYPPIIPINNTSISIFDDRVTYIGLVAILVAGVTIMFVIITIAVVIYKKSEPRMRRSQQQEPECPRLSSRYSATYELSLQDAAMTSPMTSSADRLTQLGDSYFSGHVGCDNPTYEQIPGCYQQAGCPSDGPASSVPEEHGSPTFITFARTEFDRASGAYAHGHAQTAASGYANGSSHVESSFSESSQAPPIPERNFGDADVNAGCIDALTSHADDVTYATVCRRKPDVNT